MLAPVTTSLITLWIALLPAHAADAEAELQAGVTAQRAGDTATALQHYRSCLRAEPDHVGCHWEIGWSHWKDNAWAEVTEHWRRVKALDPAHPEVDRYLPTAEGHLASLEAIRASASDAPDTVRAALPEGTTLRIRAVGDIMLGTDFPSRTYLPPDDGAHMLEQVAPLLRDADLTFGNLEGPLCDSGSSAKCTPGATNCYAFRTPTSYAAHLANAGFDMLSTANNHAEDFGQGCRRETELALTALGMASSGRPGTVASVEAKGVKVAMIGFHTSRNSHYVNDHETAAELVRAHDRDHDLVIVSFHGGAEGSKALHVPDGMETFYSEQRGHLRAFAAAVVDAGADLVLGHGPHVPRGLQLIDGHLVAYSLGNFATYGRFNLSGHLATGLVLEAVLDHDGKLVSGQILSTKQHGQGVPAPDPDRTAVDLMRTLSDSDFGKAAPIIARDGSFVPRGRAVAAAPTGAVPEWVEAFSLIPGQGEGAVKAFLGASGSLDQQMSRCTEYLPLGGGRLSTSFRLTLDGSRVPQNVRIRERSGLPDFDSCVFEVVQQTPMPPGHSSLPIRVEARVTLDG